MTISTLKAAALFVCLSVLLGISTHSYAQQHTPRLDKVIRNIENRTGGQVLSADRRRVDGEPKFRIKLLTPKGRVKILWIDP